MLFDKYEDYLNYEQNFSKHTVSAYLRDVKVFEKFLAQNDCKISNEIITPRRCPYCWFGGVGFGWRWMWR